MAETAETQSRSEGLAAKTVESSACSIGASAAAMVLGVGRSVLVAWLLKPEDFSVESAGHLHVRCNETVT